MKRIANAQIARNIGTFFGVLPACGASRALRTSSVMSPRGHRQPNDDNSATPGNAASDTLSALEDAESAAPKRRITLKDEVEVASSTDDIIGVGSNSDDMHTLYQRHFKDAPFERRLRSDESACLSCHRIKRAASLKCEHCGLLDEQTLDLPYPLLFQSTIGDFDASHPRIDLNSEKLEKLHNEYIALSSIAHPDRWIIKGKDQQQKAARIASYVNNAFHTLQSEDLRAEYILKLNGVEIGEDERVTDQNVLQGTFELLDESEDASLDELEELSTQVAHAKNEEATQINEAFRAGRMDAAKDALIKLRLWNRVANQLDDSIFTKKNSNPKDDSNDDSVESHYNQDAHDNFNSRRDR